MVFFITVIISVIGILVTLWGINNLFHKYTGQQDEIHYAPTMDGLNVALYRYRPDHFVHGREPIVMCHGLGANRFTWDLGPLPSFGRFLREQGFDVWTLDLRGRGLSSRPDRERSGRLRWGWTFDDYVKYDLPAAIKKVMDETGSKRVNWVGHSMGGMVMYAYLQNEETSHIRSAIAIGSPARFENMKHYTPASSWGHRAVRRLNALPIKPLARTVSLLGYLVPTSFFGSTRNMYPWLAMNVAESPSSGVLHQFAHWVNTGTFGPKDGSIRYDENLDKIKQPFLVVEGGADFIAPPKSVKWAADHIPHGKFAFFSKKHGALENYDHMTILMSPSAQKEVWPVMLDWLKTHSGPTHH